MISKADVVAFYADKSSGLHRYDTEDFYRLEASEKAYHLGKGLSLLDFGCGTADLLVYYAEAFGQMTGVDISQNMLDHARRRLDTFGLRQVELHCADEARVWNCVADRKFDVITSAGVMQYLSEGQIKSFLQAANSHLKSGGRIALFDLVDPRIYWMIKFGWFIDRPHTAGSVLRACAVTARRMARKFLAAVQGKSSDIMGFAHHPAVIQTIAQDQGFTVRLVRSMYYEYRYHVILEPKG